MMTFIEFKKIESARVCHDFLLPPAANTGHISILFFWATVAVECFTPTPIIPLISRIKQLVFRVGALCRWLFA
jgi:hypothetical protein